MLSEKKPREIREYIVQMSKFLAKDMNKDGSKSGIQQR